ncbi:MAG TPA: PstS family phosphate ABC transporter substrate-binding protein [Jiangellaceae bacterium]|nr:PstS family phosphate ABC transporter substrate-binding protein [Jiangellaceae bacterium]
MISKKWLRATTVAGVVALALAACGGDDGDDANTGGDETTEASNDMADLSGSIEMDGSSTVGPISEVAAELFMTENPGVQVTVGISGTGGGFERFCNGETDFSNASRPIEEDEVAACEANGVANEQITVGNDALTVMVNLENPVECLSVEQLNAIWGPESSISNWSEVPDLDVDFNEPLDLYGPGTDSGTFDYFTEAINGEEGAQRTDYNNIGEDDNTGLIGVEGTVGGMFYAGYSYYVENQDRVKALQIDGGDGCVEPSAETAQDGSYSPLSRGLFIYPSATALERPEARAFVEFYINNNEEIAGGADAIPLTEEQKSEMLDRVASLVGG